MSSDETMMTMEENGVPAEIQYNTPEAVCYDGTNIIEIDIDASMFNPPPVTPLSDAEIDALTVDKVAAVMKAGFDDARLFPDLGVPANLIVYADTITLPDGKSQDFKGCYLAKYGPIESAETWTTEALRVLTPADVLSHLKLKQNLAIYRLTSGKYDCAFMEPPPGGEVKQKQRIGLIEYYRLSSFLGAYGAGRTINTFSLLPGEKAKLAIKTYKKTSETTKEASTILDSLTDSSASDFEGTVQDERSDRSTRARMDSWHVEGELTGNWGTGSAKIEAGYKGSANTAREQFSKSVDSSLQKHVMQASNKRDIKVEQSTETTTETDDEASTEREIKNLNVGNTLNFVFRQMNQEYLTLLHLVDVRLGYTDGITTRVVPLHAMKGLLDEFIVTQKDSSNKPLPDDQQFKTKLAKAILEELDVVRDVDGKERVLTETVKVDDTSGSELFSYVRLKRGHDFESTYKVASTGTAVKVEGVVISASYNVLRTDGIITEAVLGRGLGLDTFSQELQKQTVRELHLKNDLVEQRIARELAVQELVAKKNKAAVALVPKLYPPPPPPTTT